MRARNMMFLLIATLVTVPALPQTASVTTGATASAPALVHDTIIRDGDSALVRAAKRTVALRLQALVAPVAVDAQFVSQSHGHIAISTSTGAALPSLSPQKSTSDRRAAAKPAPPPGEDRAALEQRLANQQKELHRAAEESDQPYGNEVDEDLVAKRMSQLPAEIKKTEQQLATTPPSKP